MTANSASVSVLALTWCLAGAAALFAVRGVHAQPQEQQQLSVPALQAAPVAQIEFDITAQRLGDAIEAFSKATGLDILIDGEQAQRSSSAVRGTLTAMEALEAMLSGTGLEARYANAGSIVIRAARTPGVATRAAGGEATAIEESGFSTGDGAHRAYAAQVQQALRGSLCESAQTRPGGYRLALQLRLDAQGAVERFRLLSTTGESARDAAVQRKVRGLAVGAPPPPSLPQPLVILLLPEGPGAESDCGRNTARAP
ncbi:STN domain-containing protein [Variovorax sp. GB1P17]|uniref:STN domain-containing protein n=1 Tax=Variovorax sp. GB1P17 TaxID=3443740 RepID=UPI003F45E9A5